jgi:hypothetical protein
VLGYELRSNLSTSNKQRGKKARRDEIVYHSGTALGIKLGFLGHYGWEVPTKSPWCL